MSILPNLIYRFNAIPVNIQQASLEVLQPIIYEVKKKELPFEIVPLDSSTLQNLLSSQKMGTFLYIAAPWKLKREIEKMAWSIGYSEEEMISVGIGPKPMNVFCCRCQVFIFYFSWSGDERKMRF